MGGDQCDYGGFYILGNGEIFPEGIVTHSVRSFAREPPAFVGMSDAAPFPPEAPEHPQSGGELAL